MEFSELIDKIQANTPGWVPPLVVEKLQQAVKDDGFEVAVLDEAFSKAILSGARQPLAYMWTIIKHWQEAGIRTLAEVRAEEKERQAGRPEADGKWGV